MNLSAGQNVSFYQLALDVEAPPQALALSPTTLLSQIKSVIDLLIEQQISAKLWAKLPPGEIWQSEIQRYHTSVSVPHTIYTCQMNQKRAGGAKEENTSPTSHLYLQLAPSRQLRREYFLLVLSPQFWGLILAHRPLPRGKKTPPLLVITSFEGRVIQQVLDGIKGAIAPGASSTTLADLTCPPAPEPVEALHTTSLLLSKQIQRQEEIYHRAVEKADAKAQQQNQELHKTLQLKDEYLNNVCQELRTPLTHMKTALSLLNSPSLKPPQRQRYMQMLNNECDRQNSLITGLLNLLQLDRDLDEASFESVRLSDIVPGVVSTYQPLAQEKGIMLAYTVPTDLPPVSCVGAWLRQIVINLLHNSIKFTPNGGQVWVRSRIQGDYVQLEFRDTGIGIAESEIPKIFDRFYRLRPVAGEDSGGAGLGLTVVQQLLLHCGGSISVKSKLGEGSSFNVLLPRAAEDTPEQDCV